MTLRILIFLLLAGVIYFGLRKIYRDWQKLFRAEDKRVRDSHRKERHRPDVIDLRRSDDGIFRPPTDKDKTG